MKKSIATLAIGLAVGLGLSNVSKADERTWRWSPIGIGLAAPIQLPYMSSDIYGLRISGFYGANHDVYGLDCGVSGYCSGEFRGLQVGAFDWTEGNVYGVQFGAVANVVGGRSYAAQFGLVNVVWDDAFGAQFGVLNYDTDFTGIQLGVLNWNLNASYGLEIALANANQDEYAGCALGALVNYADTFRGLELGLINTAYDMTGAQVGLVNACDRMHGVQIGLLNMICESKLPLMVIMNASF